VTATLKQLTATPTSECLGSLLGDPPDACRKVVITAMPLLRPASSAIA
jgi:hypothetical protein